jgi:hypothetical protein|nr:MAG TPA: major capsid protein [Caudoviricetes sp.]
MADLGANATTIAELSKTEGLIPKPLATEIMTKAYGDSLIGRLVGNVPMPITGGAMAFQVGEPIAGVVAEGGMKPVIKSKVATKLARPIKVAAIMYWSKEARQANPLGYMAMFKQSGTDAVRRAIDLAILHGKDGVTGAVIPGVEYVAQTNKSVELDTATADKGGLAGDILAGYQLVTDAEGDVTGFAADPKIRVKLLGARYANGLPIFSGDATHGGVNLADPMPDLMGLPVGFSKAVGGKMGVLEDSKIRLIGGDFENNMKFGYVENITYRKTDTGVINDGGTQVNLFQQNMEAYLIEAQFGWAIRDVNDFVTYKLK